MKLSSHDVINFGKLQSAANMVLIAINEQSEIQHVNRYGLKFLGLPPQAIIGKPLLEIFEQLSLMPLMNDQGKFLISTLIPGKEEFQKWEKITATVDNEQWYLLIGHPIAGKEKLFRTFLKTFVQERATIIGAEQIYLNSIIENLPELVYWKDNHFIYQGCNKNAAFLLNFKSSKEIVGKSDKELGSLFGWSEERIKKLAEVDSAVIHEGISNREEDIIPIHGVARIYLTSKNPLRDRHGKIIGLLGISTDITERKKIEEDLKLAKQMAEEASRAKTEFIANISHDIRTPLSGVIGLSEILENTLDNPTQKEEAHMLHDSGSELLSMLNDILDDVRAGSMNEEDIHLESFDLYQCIEDLIKLERPTITLKQLGLKLDIAKNVPRYIVSDRKKIHRILLNLLGNAIKFTETGHITIQIIVLKSKPLQLQLSVIDTGIGIPQSMQNKVFDRFFRITSSYKGLYKGHGLGLHIARSYVELLGGRISLTSQENIGTTSSFTLPCQKGRKNKLKVKTINRVNTSETSLPSPAKANTLHFLLVEDNKMALRVLESIVTRAGYRFKSAYTGEEALLLAKQEHFDLIITDIGLPLMSGYTLVSQIREWEIMMQKPPVPIIGLTGHAKETAQLNSLNAGMNDVFTKPIQLALLQKLVEEYCLKTNDHLKTPKPISPHSCLDLNHIPLFDTEQALNHFGGDKVLLQELLQRFIADENEMEPLQAAFFKKDWEHIKALTHKLKGTAAYLALYRLQQACQQVENAQDKDKINYYQHLIQINKKTLNYLKEWLQHHHLEPPE